MLDRRWLLCRQRCACIPDYGRSVVQGVASRVVICIRGEMLTGCLVGARLLHHQVVIPGRPSNVDLAPALGAAAIQPSSLHQSRHRRVIYTIVILLLARHGHVVALLRRPLTCLAVNSRVLVLVRVAPILLLLDHAVIHVVIVQLATRLVGLSIDSVGHA